MEDLKALLEDPKKQTVHVPENMENAINVMVVLLKLEESDGAAAFIEKRNNFIKEIENTKEIPLEALFNALKGDPEDRDQFDAGEAAAVLPAAPDPDEAVGHDAGPDNAGGVAVDAAGED